jgi:thiamine biosynthesis lipoprotein
MVAYAPPYERDTAHRSGAGPPATARWEALGSSVVLRVTDSLSLPRASAILARELDAIDRACSRFRCDSDLSRVNALAGGPPVRVSRLLIEALQVALRAAELTAGDVDPTVGAALVFAGYDRDRSLLERPRGPRRAAERSETSRRPQRGDVAACGRPAGGGIAYPDRAPTDSEHCLPPAVEPAGRSATGPPTLTARLRRGYRTVALDPVLATVRVPRGIVLDLGATAKAWAADRGARAVWDAARCGVLVSLGGDIATAGPSPAGGWRIHVTDDHRSGPDAPGQPISISSGGLATSSTAVRRWRRGAETMHHIIDPSAGAPARGPWRTVSVAAADCVDANIAATAALVRGARAERWLERIGLPARLLAHDGEVLRVCGWPPDLPAHTPPPRGTTPRAHPLVAQPPRADDPK